MKKYGKLLKYCRSSSLLKLVRIMKMMAVIMFLGCMQVTAKGVSQNRISVNFQSVEIKKALSFIEKKSDYRFVYNEMLISQVPLITLQMTDAEVTDVVTKMLANTSLTYQLFNEKLIVLKGSAAPALAETRVTGRVTNASGEPIAGVSVSIKGSTTGTSTDANGNYAITVPDNATLVFSSVGYETFEAPVEGKTTVSITMQFSTKVIDQVVVIGYGTASKRDLTGSIVKVSGKEVADKPNANPVASLQGKVSGLSVVNSGQPGQEPDIRIRGTISRYQTKPLYVVDGIFNDNINYLNPADIESIEVLKDPSSLAIFGVRGANGVIAITTRKAKGGEPSVNLTSSIGIKKIVNKPKLTDAAGFKSLYDEQRANQGSVPYPYYDLFQGNSNWIDLIANDNAIVNNNYVSITSGTDRNKFYMGIGVTYEEGLIKNETLKKYILSVNDEVKLSKSLKFGFNINGYRADLPQLHDFSSAVAATPIVEPFNTQWNVYNKLPEEIGGPQIGNPLMGVEATANSSINKEYRAVGSIFGEFTFLKNFTLRATWYGDLGFNSVRAYTPLINVYAAEIDTIAPQGGFTRSAVNQSNTTTTKFQQDYLLTYKKTFGEHSLTVMGGFTSYYEYLTGISGNVLQYVGRDPIPYDKRWWYLDVFPYGDPTTRTSTSTEWDRSTVSTLFRALYNYKGKYLLNASFRRDGSSEISPGHRYQNFGAIGAAWEVTREDFMAKQKFFDFLKVKASWGVLGNQYTGVHYPYYPNYQTGPVAVFGDNVVPAYILAYRNDPNLQWETVTSVEGGIELATFNNRLHFDANYYHKLTKNLLTFVSTGADRFYVNSGQIENKGFEASATWSDNLTNKISYSIGGNITTLNNKVKEVYTEGFTIIEGVSRTIAGYPIGHFFGYVHDGIYQSQADKGQSPDASALYADYGPGDIKFKDLNGDGKIDVNDRTVIGNPTPDFIYGINGSISYKGFELGLEFQGVYGNEVFRSWGNGNTFAVFNFRQDRLGRWTGPGTSNWEPRVSDLASINKENSTYMIEDGSYFRIRNVQVAYTFDRATIAKAHIKALKLFLNGQNLYTWKHVSGFTPEAGGSPTSFGIDASGYPIPAIYTFGVNVTF